MRHPGALFIAVALFGMAVPSMRAGADEGDKEDECIAACKEYPEPSIHPNPQECIDSCMEDSKDGDDD